MLEHRTVGVAECIVRLAVVVVAAAAVVVVVVVEEAAIVAVVVVADIAAAGDVDVEGLPVAVVRILKSNRKTRLPDRYR